MSDQNKSSGYKGSGLNIKDLFEGVEFSGINQKPDSPSTDKTISPTPAEFVLAESVVSVALETATLIPNGKEVNLDDLENPVDGVVDTSGMTPEEAQEAIAQAVIKRNEVLENKGAEAKGNIFNEVTVRRQPSSQDINLTRQDESQSSDYRTGPPSDYAITTQVAIVPEPKGWDLDPEAPLSETSQEPNPSVAAVPFSPEFPPEKANDAVFSRALTADGRLEQVLPPLSSPNPVRSIVRETPPTVIRDPRELKIKDWLVASPPFQAKVHGNRSDESIAPQNFSITTYSRATAFGLAVAALAIAATFLSWAAYPESAEQLINKAVTTVKSTFTLPPNAPRSPLIPSIP